MNSLPPQAPKIVGNDSLVRELALTGRFFDAGVAEKLGFLSRVVEGSKEEVLGASSLLYLCLSSFY